MPGWTVYNGDVALSQIYYESNILGHAAYVELESGTLALSGNNLSVGLYDNASITQTGLVPNNVESLQFEASTFVNLSVTLGGENLSYTAISENPEYYVYEASIPAALDGQMEPLTFGVNPSGETLLDDIVFSTPEPSEYALIGLGAILFGLWRCRKVPMTR